jgi:Domain of unknown function (DUF4349)/Putative zinc-finger
MSEHDWVLEHLAGYLAGGLNAEERERLEQHTAACPACGQALGEAAAVDQTLTELFQPAQPGPALEDRMIRSLRAASWRNGWVWFPIPLAAAAAVLLLGAVGAVLSQSLEKGTLSFPGAEVAQTDERATATNMLRQYAGILAVDQSQSAAARNDLGSYDLSRARSAKGTPAAPAPLDAEQMAQELRDRAARSVAVSRDGVSPTAESLPTSTPEVMDRPAGAPAGAGPAGQTYRVPTGGGEAMRGRAGGLVANGTAGPGGRPALDSFYAAPKPSAGPRGMMGPAGGPGGPGGMPGAGTAPSSSATPSRTESLGEVKLPAVLHFKPATLGDEAAGKEYKKGDAGKDTNLAKGTNAPAGKPAEAKQAEAEKALEDRTVRAVKVQGMDPRLVEEAMLALGRTGKQAQDPKAAAEQAQPAPRKIVIRSGDLEFEIDSFDSAVGTISKLVGAIPGGFVATINSDKLANGKVRGTVVVRVPPERLDGLVLDLRKELGKTGELKSQRIGSQDITKQYTDLESRLKAARTMEARLLEIIKSGKGEIKDLLAAEKELGVWRTKIEEFEGEKRYYDNLVSLSTLTITLSEKELRAPAVITEVERVNMGVEVEDVDKAQRAVVAAVTEAKGRITRSELKQHAAGQFSAVIHFEVTPDMSGPLRDRLRQLGTVTRLEIDRVQQPQDGTVPLHDTKSRRAETQFFLSLYNIVNVAPRETVHLNLAAADAEAAYRLILARVQKTAGRVLTSQLSRQQANQTTGTLQFEVPAAEADTVLRELKDVGEVLRLQVTENPDAQNVTRAKRGFVVQVYSLWQVTARETTTLQVATKDVPANYRLLQDTVAKAKGHVHNAHLNEQDKQNVTATLDVEVRRADEAAVEAALAKVGEVYGRSVQRAPDAENVTDSKVRLQITLINQAKLPARETVVLGIEAANVEATAALLTALVRDSQGQVVTADVAHERNGQVTARLVFDVPLGSASGLVEKFKDAGTIRVQQTSRNPQAPEGALAIARLDVTLSNPGLIVPRDDGVWAKVRDSLRFSFTALLWSLMFVIIGVCVVLPWAVIVYLAWRVVVRLRRRAAGTAPTA